MLNRRQARPARVLRRAAILGPLLLALLPLTPAQAAIDGRGFVWVVRDPPTQPTDLAKYDLLGNSSGFGLASDFTDAVPHGRGVAVSSKGAIFYSLVALRQIGQVEALTGDGRIYRTDAVGTRMPSIAEPGGFKGPGIGAMDLDGKLLWVITHNPGGPHAVYGLDPDNNGAVIASCLVTNSSDTVALAVQRGTFFTDAGFDGHRLDQFMLPETPSAGACTFVASYNLPFRLGGIDFAKGGSLYAVEANTGMVNDMGGPPYDTILGSFQASSPQDISAVSR